MKEVEKIEQEEKIILRRSKWEWTSTDSPTLPQSISIYLRFSFLLNSPNGCFYTFREPFYKSSPRLTSNSESTKKLSLQSNTIALIDIQWNTYYSMANRMNPN